MRRRSSAPPPVRVAARVHLAGTTIVAAVMLAVFAATALAAASDRDVAFGVDGFVTTDFGGTEDRGHAVAVQPDGGIVVAGGRNAGGDRDSDDFALARFTDGGGVDTTFGAAGKVVTDFGTNRDEAHAVAVQDDGKIVAAGWNAADFVLARYDADGSLDPTFGVGGKTTTDLGANDFIDDIAVTGDGRIVAVGGGRDFAVVRYRNDGSLDPTFGVSGKVTTEWPPHRSSVAAVAIQNDGKIVVAGGAGSFFGRVRGPAGASGDFALARYHPDGSVDHGFGGDGKVTTDFGGPADVAFAVALQADGKIVAAGRGSDLPNTASRGFAVARYNADGTPDATFGAGGRTILPVGSIAEAVVVQPGGRIVVGGSTGRSGSWNFALVGLAPDGSLDSVFSFDGVVEDDLGGTADDLVDLTLDAERRIVAAGSRWAPSDTTGLTTDFAVVRYLPNGEVETVPPETELLDGPAQGRATAATSATFAFTGSDNVDTPGQLVFACSLDAAAFTACTSPAVYGGLGDGVHVLAVRAHDRSGNVDPTPATRTWIVDTTAPETAISSSPTRLTRERSASFAFSGEDALTAVGDFAYLCALDGGAAVACTSPHSLTRIPDGRHAIAVQAVDLAGNVDASAATHEWTVDGTPPTKPRVRGPRKTTSRRPTYRFSATDALTPRAELQFLCAFDSARLRPCPPVYRRPLRPGTHVLRVSAEDEAGNRSAVARLPVVVLRKR
jgi:uncharacterized delta-60 repeat protein